MKQATKKRFQWLFPDSTHIGWLLSHRRYVLTTITQLRGVHPRRCPICLTHERFYAAGSPPRFDARCPQCGSLERHRLLVLKAGQHGFLKGAGSILHFAPEPIIERYLRAIAESYTSADLYGKADRRENIEAISLADGSMNIIVCSHVLEHVDDRAALREIHRVLKPRGLLIAMVPIHEGWDKTYENPQITDPLDRELHFGQSDHVRYYGRDFQSRLEGAGFSVSAYTGTPAECIEYGLLPGEKVFVCEKL